MHKPFSFDKSVADSTKTGKYFAVRKAQKNA